MEVEREAKLFEAGSYPDKGLEVSEAQLERLVSSFQEPVPVLIEHLSSEWRIGQLEGLWRRGKELFGRLKLLAEAEALLRRLGMSGVSVAVTPDVSRIVEVSVTATPRVADARLLPEGAVAFRGELVWSEEASSWRQRAEAAESALREHLADQTVQRWLQQGKVSPAVREMARALLCCGSQSVMFAGRLASPAEVFFRFVEALPPVVAFGERAPAGKEADFLLSAEQEAFIRKHWGDVAVEQIAQYLRKEGS